MLFWDSGKAPAEVADYDVDWTLRLAGDTIVGSFWAITAGDAPASGTLAILWSFVSKPGSGKS